MKANEIKDILKFLQLLVEGHFIELQVIILLIQLMHFFNLKKKIRTI